MHRYRSWFTIGSLCSLAMSGMAAGPAQAEDYPTRPVRIIADSAPGSSIDAIIRVTTDALSRRWGQQALVINQPGAGGALAARSAAAATPDGYTLFIAALSTFVAAPGAAPNLPIQVPRDFAPVGYFGGAPMFITVAAGLGVKTLPELIALAKTRPGELTYGTNGPGRLTHLTGELLQSHAGIKLLMVPYSGGTAQVLNDVMGGRISLLFDSFSGLAGAVEAGSVRPLAIAASTRSADFPNLPTAAETLPGFEAVGWQVLMAPAGTPADIVQKVNADLIKATSEPATNKRLAQLGRDARPMTPAETLAFIQSEQQKWAPVVQQIGATR